jgi:hypothetical protein
MSGRASRRDFLVTAGIFPFSLFRRDPAIAGIRFREVRRGTDRRRYIWIHANEQTAREVLENHMSRVDGRAFFIDNGGERNVTIRGGKLDPNRMFSRAGAERNLRALNPIWTPAQLEDVLDELDDDRDSFLRDILPEAGALIVALHNNSPNYSVKDELAISNAVALNDEEHPDEFMLCSVEADFAVLANSGFNALLQDEPQGEDDGSLSRLCALRRIRYVNIEAAQGNAEAQRRMLQWLEIAIS